MYLIYCDFKSLFNRLVSYITGVSVFGTHVRIWTPCIIIRIPYIWHPTLNKLYIIDESIRHITIILFIINVMINLF